MIASTIGAIARDLLKAGAAVIPMGLTSRGLFLRLDGRWVIFLSTEPYPGPLTVNITGDFEPLKQLEHVAEGVVGPESIYFPAANLNIPVHLATEWQPPPRVDKNLPPLQTREILMQVARILGRQKTAGGIGACLPALWGEQVEHKRGNQRVLPLVLKIKDALRLGQIPSIIEALEPMLGFGAGLTPSGDDLIAGLLLALNRWGYVLAPGMDIAGLNQAALDLAYSRTTLLSANLIECASIGQADERLITALDGLITGVPDAATCASNLSQWGNTSGYDALCGMALALIRAV